MKLHKKRNGKNKVRQIIERTWPLSLLYGFFSISFVRTPCQWYWNAYTVNTNQWKHLESHVKQNNAQSRFPQHKTNQCFHFEFAALLVQLVLSTMYSLQRKKAKISFGKQKLV